MTGVKQRNILNEHRETVVIYIILKTALLALSVIVVFLMLLIEYNLC